MTAPDILRGPHKRSIVINRDKHPVLIVEPLRFIPVVLVHANRTRRAMAKVAA